MRPALVGLLGGAAVLALAAAAVVLFGREAPPRRNTHVAAVVPEPRSNEVLEERLRRLEQRMAAVAAAPAPAASTAVEATAATAESDERDPELAKLPGPDRALVRSQRRYEREGADDRWSEETTSQLATLMETLPGAEVVSADCRQTVCRIETRYDSDAAAEAFDLRMIEMPFMKNTRFQMRDVTDAEGRRVGHELFVGRLQENRKSIPKL